MTGLDVIYPVIADFAKCHGGKLLRDRESITVRLQSGRTTVQVIKRNEPEPEVIEIMAFGASGIGAKSALIRLPCDPCSLDFSSTRTILENLLKP